MRTILIALLMTFAMQAVAERKTNFESIALSPSDASTDNSRVTQLDDSIIFEEIFVPFEQKANEPSITSHKGSLYMSWMEHSEETSKVMFSILSSGIWSEPRTVYSGRDLFVNWADYPSIAVLEDGTVALHWLRELRPSTFDYKIQVSLSQDRGKSWTEPITPHEDLSITQHGFVSIYPNSSDTFSLVWLDGRTYGNKVGKNNPNNDKMQLRATTLSREGQLSEDVAVDLNTCSCCQTSLSKTKKGTIVAAYRDRTTEEIRDISIVRLTSSGWEKPISVNQDGWEIAGCPVNGPSISSNNGILGVVWFTGANDIPAIKVAFSDDDGREFDNPIRIDLGNPLGRVDLEILNDETALASWVEWVEDDEVLILCSISRKEGCMLKQKLTINPTNESINFPKIEIVNDYLYAAWTRPTKHGDTIALVRTEINKFSR